MMINDEPASRFTAGGPYANCPDSGCPSGTPTSPGPADLGSIVTHEIGHFIGIGHSEIEEATMFASNARESVEKRTLAPDDIAAVCTVYPPGNLDQTCDPAPKGGLELDCEQKACTTGPCSARGHHQQRMQRRGESRGRAVRADLRDAPRAHGVASASALERRAILN